MLGLAALVLGPLVGAAFVFLSLAGGRVGDAAGVAVIGLNVAALGLGFGAALAWTGYRGVRGAGERPFHPALRWFWFCLIGMGGALAAGQAVILLNLAPPVTFPPFHVLAVALPALAILLLAGYTVRRDPRAPTQRHIIAQSSLGAFGATAIALSLELIVVVVGVVAAVTALALTPGGLDRIVELQSLLEDPVRLQESSVLVGWLLEPPVLATIILVLVFIAPLVEEAAKSVGVPLLAWWGQYMPSPLQGWLGGLALGTGFAITEGLFNTAAGLAFWAAIALLRLGATAMHITTAGITGLGWAGTLASRRPWSLLAGYLASVTLHSVWNALTVLMFVASLLMVDAPADATRVTLAGLGVLAGLVGLFLIALLVLVVLVLITLRVRRVQVPRGLV
jgi:hypothetical protein